MGIGIYFAAFQQMYTAAIRRIQRIGSKMLSSVYVVYARYKAHRPKKGQQDENNYFYKFSQPFEICELPSCIKYQLVNALNQKLHAVLL